MQRTIKAIQVDSLTRKLEENCSGRYPSYDDNASTSFGENTVSLRESKAICVIKQLQEQVCFSLYPFTIWSLFEFNVFSLFTYFLCICHLNWMFYLQIKLLEMEKSSIQQNLDSVVELATEQNKYAREKFEQVISITSFMHHFSATNYFEKDLAEFHNVELHNLEIGWLCLPVNFILISITDESFHDNNNLLKQKNWICCRCIKFLSETSGPDVVK